METTSIIFIYMVSVSVLVTVNGQFDPCRNRDEGFIVEISCKGYKTCRGGQVVDLRCPEGFVLERDSKLCFLPGTANTACGLPGNCFGRPDGLYPDVQFGCQSFISCAGGTFRGRIYCPANLVYNTAAGACDFPGNVAYPCGTGIAISPQAMSSVAAADDNETEAD